MTPIAHLVHDDDPSTTLCGAPVLAIWGAATACDVCLRIAMSKSPARVSAADPGDEDIAEKVERVVDHVSKAHGVPRWMLLGQERPDPAVCDGALGCGTCPACRRYKGER